MFKVNKVSQTAIKIEEDEIAITVLIDPVTRVPSAKYADPQLVITSKKQAINKTTKSTKGQDKLQ